MNIENNSLIDNLINMSGLSEWIEKLPNGHMHSPSKTNAYKITVTLQDLMNAYMIMNQPKQYTTDGNTVIKEGDTKFDINKWVELIVKQISK